MPSAYLTREALAAELMMAESTVSDMVRRRILPPPVRLSSGCVRWRWASVEMRLASLEEGNEPQPETDMQARIQRAIQAAKDRGRGRAA